MASWCVCSGDMTKRYNVRNGEQQVLGRSDLPMAMPKTVSREQCTITVGNDGFGTVTSMGRRPTGVRENYVTPWAWLLKDQRKVIADGTMISLDVNNPEGHVFTFFVLVDERPIRKRQRGDEKGEQIIVILAHSHSHAHALMLAHSNTHTQTRTLFTQTAGTPLVRAAQRSRDGRPRRDGQSRRDGQRWRPEARAPRWASSAAAGAQAAGARL